MTSVRLSQQAVSRFRISSSGWSWSGIITGLKPPAAAALIPLKPVSYTHLDVYKRQHYRLALEMDTSPNNIGNLFRRTTVPSIPTIRRICEVMGITMAQFYSTDGIQVTLNEQQRRIMDLYDKLDPLDKSKAEAYMEGLSAKAKDI